MNYHARRGNKALFFKGLLYDNIFSRHLQLEDYRLCATWKLFFRISAQQQKLLLTYKHVKLMVIPAVYTIE